MKGNPEETLRVLMARIDELIKSAVELHHQDNAGLEETQYWQGYADAGRAIRTEVARVLHKED